MELFPPKAVVFDLDGVILDSFAANVSYYGYIARQMGLKPLSGEDEQIVHRLTHEGALTHIAGESRLQEALEWGNDFNARQMQKGHKAFPGVGETLAYLYDKVPLAVGTNRNTSATGILRELGLMDYFQLVLTAGLAPKPKPDKAFMSHLLDIIGFTPQEVVYVGDSLVDQELCENSQVRLVAFQNQGLKAWAYTDDFIKIPGLLGL